MTDIEKAIIKASIELKKARENGIREDEEIYETILGALTKQIRKKPRTTEHNYFCSDCGDALGKRVNKNWTRFLPSLWSRTSVGGGRMTLSDYRNYVQGKYKVGQVKDRRVKAY